MIYKVKIISEIITFIGALVDYCKKRMDMIKKEDQILAQRVQTVHLRSYVIVFIAQPAIKYWKVTSKVEWFFCTPK